MKNEKSEKEMNEMANWMLEKSNQQTIMYLKMILKFKEDYPEQSTKEYIKTMINNLQDNLQDGN